MFSKREIDRGRVPWRDVDMAVSHWVFVKAVFGPYCSHKTQLFGLFGSLWEPFLGATHGKWLHALCVYVCAGVR